MKRYKMQIIAIGASLLFTIFTIVILTLAIKVGEEKGFDQGYNDGFEAGRDEGILFATDVIDKTHHCVVKKKYQITQNDPTTKVPAENLD